MNQYTAVILTLTATMACFMALRMHGDWLRIEAAGHDGALSDLDRIRAALNRWQMRHLTGAVISVALCTGIGFLSVLAPCARFASAVAAYAVVSCCLATTEAILMQRLTVVRVRVHNRR
ncbi:hypothetical protein [Geobacter argillaceus]|uniref:Uncharacterized protein n=1 Tax=Geobacter argillaceus TaxID=345631 RepID=A0A562VNJ6_9BACT|nr:hypothetical protein [Geobacter argillaceus]TWJ19563.1 hypothetical protein JN12_01680 [Geobacter argillaceus]